MLLLPIIKNMIKAPKASLVIVIPILDTYEFFFYKQYNLKLIIYLLDNCYC